MKLSNLKTPLVILQKYQSRQEMWSVSNGEELIDKILTPEYEEGDYNSDLFEMWDQGDWQFANAVACLAHDTVACLVLTAAEFCERYDILRRTYPHFCHWAWDEFLEYDDEVPVRYVVEFSQNSTWLSHKPQRWSYATAEDATEDADSLSEEMFGVIYRELAFAGNPITQINFGNDERDRQDWIDSL